jgi:protein-S-isoprenylcysteine O-methyltransferase Ste14
VNAALDRSAVPAAIVALGVTVLGLSAVNGSDALEAVLDGRTTIAYWVQTGLITLYFILLVVLYAAGKRLSRSDE